MQSAGLHTRWQKRTSDARYVRRKISRVLGAYDELHRSDSQQELRVTRRQVGFSKCLCLAATIPLGDCVSVFNLADSCRECHGGKWWCFMRPFKHSQRISSLCRSRAMFAFAASALSGGGYCRACASQTWWTGERALWIILYNLPPEQGESSVRVMRYGRQMQIDGAFLRQEVVGLFLRFLDSSKNFTGSVSDLFTA